MTGGSSSIRILKMSVFNIQNEDISLRQAVLSAAEFLNKCGVEDADTDVMLLLEKAAGYSRNRYFMCRDEKMEPDAKAAFSKMVTKRGERIPLQHITGEAYFYGRRFIVDESVLVPRMDTEILVEEALKDIKPGMSVLDLCTGSGCIAVTLAKEADIKITASDISGRALDTAKKNALLNKADCEFVRSDMFENINSRFDVIVSNPPYIRRGDIGSLQEEVREHDPLNALDGGDDGLDFYRIISYEGKKHLYPHGRIYLEIGSDQAEAVSRLLSAAGFAEICVVKDLNGLQRVVKAKLQ